MSTSDPTVEDVIAEAAREVLRRRLGGHVGSSWSAMSADVAAAVVAAVRAMTAEQLVDLRPDLTVEDFCLPGGCGKVRIVRPWRAEP